MLSFICARMPRLRDDTTSGVLPRAPCAWDAIECLLKASLEPKEDAMLVSFRRGYEVAFGWASCFPRLHLITYETRLARAQGFFNRVPNVSVRANNLPPRLEHSRHPAGKGASYFVMQWHAVWADNFTSAPHVLVFDVDSVPVMPLRCHHLFDDAGRVVWRSWLWHHPSPWVHPVSSVFYRAQHLGARFRTNLTVLTRGRRFEQRAAAAAAMRTPVKDIKTFPTLEMMATFPIVIPRAVLPEMRRLVLLSSNGTASCFDDAYVQMVWPSHGDLIGKTALLQFPELIRLAHCPSPTRTKDELLPGEPWEADPLACRTYVAPVEHVRHPIQGCTAGIRRCKYYTAHPAAAYASRLISSVRNYTLGLQSTLPVELFMYEGLDAATRANATRHVMRADEPAGVCGRPHGGSPTLAANAAT